MGAASVAALFLFFRHKYPPEKIRQELEAALTSRSGYEASIGGLDYTWSGDIRLTKLCLKPRLFVSDRCFVHVDNLRLSVSLLSLVRKKPDITSVSADRLRIELFADSAKQPAGKEAAKSWQRSLAQPTGTVGGSTTALNVGRIDIEAGEILQDIPSVKLKGRHGFSLHLKGNDSKTLALNGEIEGQGGFQLNAEFSGMGFAAISAALHERKLPPMLTLKGDIMLKALNLAALDRRLARADGKISFTRVGEQVVFSPENLSVQLSSPVMKVLLSGRFPVAPGDLSVRSAQGNVAQQGLNAQFENVDISPGKPVSGNFRIAGELKVLAAPRDVAGNFAADGKIQDGHLSAQISLRDFALPLAGQRLTAPVLSAQLADDVVLLKSQRLSLGRNSFIANMTITRRAQGPLIRGSLAFGEVVLEESAAAGSAPTGEQSATSADVALRVSATKLHYGKWQLSDITAQIKLAEDGLNVENGSLIVARGRLNFHYRSRGASKQLRFTAAGLKADEVSRMLALKGTVYGLIHAQGVFEWSGQGSDAFVKTATGNVSGSLGRGKIREGFFQKGILTGPLNRLEDKFQDIEFASAEFSAVAKNGFIELKRAYFDAEEWNLALRAESDSAGQGKASLTFRFKSRFVENVASPLHLGISSRLDGEFYDLPFACRGNILSAACYKQNW